MKPSEVRLRIVSDHNLIRAMIADAHLVVTQSARGNPLDVARLFRVSRHLRETLAQHFAMEEELLVPALRDTDAWGQIRANRVLEDHETQRAALDVLADLEQRSNIPELRQALLSLGDLMVEDMHREEQACLQPDLLRDDTVAVRQHTG